MDAQACQPKLCSCMPNLKNGLTYVEHIAGSLVWRTPILYDSIVVRLHLGPSLARWRQPLSLLCPPRQAVSVPAHVTIPERVKGVLLLYCELHSCYKASDVHNAFNVAACHTCERNTRRAPVTGSLSSGLGH